MENIKLDPRNYRKHDERNISLIKKSLLDCGVGRSIVIDNNDVIIAGNGVFEQAQALGLNVRVIESDGKELFAIKRTDLSTSDGRRKLLAMADNRTSDTSEFDFDLLKEDFNDGILEDFDIWFDDLVDDEDPHVDTDDDDFVPPHTHTVETDISYGNIFEIRCDGLIHRIMCGDSTKIIDVKKLMNGAVADMVFCDPPYNLKINSCVNLGNTIHNEFIQVSGDYTEDEFIEFLTSVFKNLTAITKDGSIHYHCMDWRHIYEIVVAGRASYTELKNLCIWNKTNGGMGTFYRSKHELVFVFKNGEALHTNNFELGQFGRYRTNVWDYSGMNSFANYDRIINQEGLSVSKNNELLKLHPTVKPIPMIADAILDCSMKGELIVDLFSGSGSTLIASQKTGRRCFTMELDPKYCQVTLDRFEKDFPDAEIIKISN